MEACVTRSSLGAFPEIDPALPVVAVDFDGVLAEANWPNPGIGHSIQAGIDLVLHYRHVENCEVVIFTARPESHFPRIWKWLDSVGLHGVIYDVTNRKPTACLYFDDRARRFPLD